ncbi:801_t:CDS:2, partial [Gigaspora rosea]
GQCKIENNNLVVEQYGIENYDLDQHIVVEQYGIENYDLVEERYEFENNNLVERQYEIENYIEGRYEIVNENLEQHEVETEEGENIAIEPILESELEGLDSMKYSLITSSIELSFGIRFSSWEIAEYYLKEYGRQKGFAIKRKYKPNKTKSIGQQHNKGSKRTDCKWHINLSSPGYTNYMHITFAYLEHNYEINADNNSFLNDEIQESYEWVLQQTLDTAGSELCVFITDMDFAMDTS